MPRLQPAEQALKESALESLRDAMASEGVVTRPRLGRPGYDAVQRAMSVWLGVEFSTVDDVRRLATLRAATQWEAERRKRSHAHAAVDPAIKKRLTAELTAMFKAANENANSVKQPTRRKRAPEPEAPTEGPAAAASIKAVAPPPKHAKLTHASLGVARPDLPLVENNTAAPEDLIASSSPAPLGGQHPPPSPPAARATTKRHKAAHPPAGSVVDHNKVSATHASIHGKKCPHTDQIARRGAVVCQHKRPGDTKPHIDFLLGDGTLDCQFDDLCEFMLGDGPLIDCCNGLDMSFDFNVPGAFSIRHHDHTHHSDVAAKSGEGIDLCPPAPANNYPNHAGGSATAAQQGSSQHQNCGCSLYLVGDTELDLAHNLIAGDVSIDPLVNTTNTAISFGMMNNNIPKYEDFAPIIIDNNNTNNMTTAPAEVSPL